MNLLKNRLLWTLAFAHFSVDIFANLTPMMLPLLMVSLDLDYTRVGLIATMFSTTASLGQPIFGYLADRFGGRLMAPLGIVWTSFFVGMVGFAPDYTTLLAIMFLAGLGLAAFHPQGAMNTSLIGGERRGSAMSIFMLGGNVGFSLGPIIGGMLLVAYGLRGTAFLIIPGLILGAWVFRAMAAVERNRKIIVSDPGTPTQRPRIAIIGVTALVLIIMLRVWSTSGLTSFVPLLYGERGYPMDAAAQVLFVALMGVAIGGLLGGFLSDHVGRRKVVFFSLLLSSPLLYLFFSVPPPLSIAVVALLGLAQGASFSITIVMSQELLPKNMGMASGLTMGFAFVTGGIGMVAIGNVADKVGLSSALDFLAILPIAAALLCFALQADKPKVEAKELAKV